MAKHKITNQFITNLVHPTDGQIFYRDGELTGFGVRAAATKATYIAEGRIGPGGKMKRITIGDCAKMPLKQARDIARELLLKMSRGEDPTERKPQFKVPTLRLALADYLSNRQLRENSSRQYKHAFSCYLSDLLDRPITAITRDDVKSKAQALVRLETVLDETTGRMVVKERGGAIAAKALTMLQSVLNFSIAFYRTPDDQPVLASNPCAVLSQSKIWPSYKPRTNFLSAQTLPSFGYGLFEIESVRARALLLFLALSGLRRDEARLLTWGEIDLKAKTITLPAERVKTATERQIPITTQLEAILEEMAEQQDLLGANPYVFGAPAGRSPIAHTTTATAAHVIRDRVGQPDFSPHSLRRTYITHARRIADSADIRRLVGHAKTQTDEYDQSSAEDLREAAQRIADKLTTLIFGKTTLPTDFLETLKVSA
ncbi:MAG: integrase family protein [Cyanobacteria bacterium SZAS LIN-3]|nr:integrase family protein [Cyanobacteria bacterium SZAS LIN-3]